MPSAIWEPCIANIWKNARRLFLERLARERKVISLSPLKLRTTTRWTLPADSGVTFSPAVTSELSQEIERVQQQFIMGLGIPSEIMKEMDERCSTRRLPSTSVSIGLSLEDQDGMTDIDRAVLGLNVPSPMRHPPEHTHDSLTYIVLEFADPLMRRLRNCDARRK